MDDTQQENQSGTGIPQPEPSKEVKDEAAIVERLKNISDEIHIQPTPEPAESKKPVYITDLPYCPVRVGRVFDGAAIPTCGYREITIQECLECIPQHMLNENKILNGKENGQEFGRHQGLETKTGNSRI